MFRLKFALLAKIGVFEAKEVYDIILHVKAPFCLLIHFDYTIIRQNLQ